MGLPIHTNYPIGAARPSSFSGIVILHKCSPTAIQFGYNTRENNARKAVDVWWVILSRYREQSIRLKKEAHQNLGPYKDDIPEQFVYART